MREWLEDALALLAIVGTLILGIWIAYGLGLPTGGDALMEAL